MVKIEEDAAVCTPRSLEFDAGRCVAGYFPSPTPAMFELARAGLPKTELGFTPVYLHTCIIRVSRVRTPPCPGQSYTDRQLELLRQHEVPYVPVQLRMPPKSPQPAVFDRAPWARLGEIWERAVGRPLEPPTAPPPVLPCPERRADRALPPPPAFLVDFAPCWPGNPQFPDGPFWWQDSYREARDHMYGVCAAQWRERDERRRGVDARLAEVADELSLKYAPALAVEFNPALRDRARDMYLTKAGDVSPACSVSGVPAPPC